MKLQNGSLMAVLHAAVKLAFVEQNLGFCAQIRSFQEGGFESVDADDSLFAFHDDGESLFTSLHYTKRAIIGVLERLSHSVMPHKHM